jgi:hypothetical protein
LRLPAKLGDTTTTQDKNTNAAARREYILGIRHGPNQPTVYAGGGHRQYWMNEIVIN